VDRGPSRGGGLIHSQRARSIVVSGDQSRDVRAGSHRTCRAPPRHEDLGRRSGNGKLASHICGADRGSPRRRVDACAKAIHGSSQNSGDRYSALGLPPNPVDRASACLRCRRMRARTPGARPMQHPLHELVSRSGKGTDAEDHAAPLTRSRSSCVPTRGPTLLSSCGRHNESRRQ